MEATGIISPGQIRAARSLLGWDGPSLAETAGVSLSTVRRLETGTAETSSLAMRAIVAALERAGVEFLEGGARIKPKARK